MLMSLDGKISTGFADERDFDQDLPKIDGIRDGLHQYYDLEKQTDWYSFNTGRVMAKVGWNEAKTHIDQLPVIFVIVDNKPHLTAQGLENLICHTEKLYIVTTNPNHPAMHIHNERLEVITYDRSVNFLDLFKRLEEGGAKRITIQSGGTMNALLIRNGLIDEVSIVIAPLLVGGEKTPTLIDGESIESIDDLQNIRTLELISIKKLEHSYLHVRYRLR